MAGGCRNLVSRNVLVGWVFVKRRLKQPYRVGEEILTHKVEAVPLLTESGDFEDGGLLHGRCVTFLGRGDDVVGVLPAPPGSYDVWGFSSDPKSPASAFLGYEFTGADNPDWERLRRERLEEQEASE